MITGRNIGRVREGKKIPNPLDNSFLPDERETWDFLSYMVDYMKLVHFYNAENKPEGDWSEILLRDPIFFKATIITSSLQGLEDKAVRLDQDIHSVEKESELINELLNWYFDVDRWITGLTRLGELKLADKIEGIHQGILKKFKLKLVGDLQKLSLIDEDETKPINPDLNRAFLTYQKAIKYVQDITKESVVQNIYDNDGHSPNNALYLSFILLLEHIQKKINDFPRRHLDFYYRNILHQIERKGTPTKAIVSFTLKERIERSIINDKIRLSAGKLFGKSTETIFGITKPLTAHPVSIENMFSILLNKNPYIKAGTQENIISNVLRKDIVNSGETILDLDKEKTGLFGADFLKAQHTAQPEKSIGEMGFIISSPSLYLSEGQREIHVHFAMDHRSAESQFWKLLKEVARSKEESVRSAYKTIFSKAFIPYFSTSEEWIGIEAYKISLDEKEDVFSLHLSVDIMAPAIDRLENDTIKWPALKIILNPYAPVYAYSFLKGLKLRAVRLEVEATQLRNLSVYNDLGRIDLNTSFNLFGPIPKLGSTVKIGKSEIFKKNITALSLNIDWENLPKEVGGFEDYYSRYPQAISNDNYRVKFSVLNKGKWIPKENGIIEEEKLFESTKVITPEGYEEDELIHSSRLSFNQFREVSLSKKNYKLEDPIDYNANRLDGFIRFSLSSPEEAFGYEIYPELVAAVSIHNAKKKRNVPLPNKPFVPRVKGLEMSYKSEDSISFEASKSNMESTSHNISEFYHLSPLGRHAVLQNQEVLNDSLLYDFDHDGQLYLELNNASGVSMLSVYMDLDDTLTISTLPDFQASIFYRQRNEWVELPKRNIVKDETLGFIKSGILELNLPENREEEGNNRLWLKIVSKSEAIKYPYLKGIYFNATEAICLDQDENSVGLNIPELQINKVVGAYPDIKSVIQPNKSFGGVLKESERRFYHRTANRLRHKNRALTSWDYEQLILDEFNDVNIIKCTNADAHGRPQTDQVKIIVISKDWTEHNFNLFSRDILYRMTDHLYERTNSYVELEVINPKFEYLLVNCTLEMEEDAIGGHYIEEVNRVINDFLSPHNQISSGFGGLGGDIVPVILMSQLEKLDFVKKGKYLSLEHIIQDGANKFSLGVFTGNKKVKTTTPWSIMVPMEEHNIYVHDSSIEEGIGHFQLEKDFIISNKATQDEDTSLDAWWKNRKETQLDNGNKSSDSLMILNFKPSKDGEEK
ncbi:MAG: hypothetical protein MK078_02355 [Crocinitomicaceae bacterium]|nr:hypothetical protein [Crocinitomicaceae bacterium]